VWEMEERWWCLRLFGYASGEEGFDSKGRNRAAVAQFRVWRVTWRRREVVGGDGATRMLRRRPWDIAFANASQGEGRAARNRKPSRRAWFRVCRIKRRWREAVGGGGATRTM
jgi:hypothetical protein